MAIGDWGRTGHPDQYRLAQQLGTFAEEHPLDFVVSTGDNFYDSGVTSVADPQWQTAYESVYNHTALQVPWYPVLGNHDYDGCVQSQIDYSQLSPRWCLPARYHHFEYPGCGGVLFAFTDTSPFISDYYLTEPKPNVMMQDSVRQLRWLQKVLATSTARWKIVVGHHPVYSSSPFHGNAPELIETFEPLFEEYEVDLYLCGHEHDLQLHQPEGHTHYLVSGAGSEVRETGWQPFTCFSAAASGVAMLTLTAEHLTIRFVDQLGRNLYEKQLAKSCALSF
jgi:3',5'-cyclic AMP phosphodiesterase CpdA